LFMSLSSPMPVPNRGINDSGVTPMKVLDSQEKVLYESRPKLASIIGWKSSLLAVVSTLVLLPLSAILSGTTLVVLSLVVLWAFILGGTLGPSSLRRHSSYYTLTDQRILWETGVASKEYGSASIRRMTGLEDVNTGRITGVKMSVPFSGRVFGYGNIVFERSTGPPIVWKGVKHPYQARQFIEGSINQLQEAQGQQIIFKDEVTRTLARVATEQKLGLLPKQTPYQMTSSTQAVGAQALPPQVSQPMTLQCTKCGISYPSETKFCSQCGGPLQPIQPQGVPLEA